MSTRCISHAQIQTVSHSSSSNTSIALLHHSNKFTIINCSILKEHTYSRASELDQEPNSWTRSRNTNTDRRLYKGGKPHLTKNNSKKGKSACQLYHMSYLDVQHVLWLHTYKPNLQKVTTPKMERIKGGGKPHLTKKQQQARQIYLPAFHQFYHMNLYLTFSCVISAVDKILIYLTFKSSLYA